MSRSRPTSGSLMPGAVIVTPPSLSEILANTSSPPWTLAAFMAYLSQNHCLETLEFTMDAERYRKDYDKFITNKDWAGEGGNDHVCQLWEKLMQAYIIPYSPREVNLPSPVRDRLIAQTCSTSPPSPSELDEAVRIVYELMNDSVLLPFIESALPNHSDVRMDEDPIDSRQGRSRARGADEVGASGATSRSASASGEHIEREGLTDDSGSAVSPGTEPMTPPTTPPTSDWTFSSTSPGGGFQRALTAHNNGWKKESEVMLPSTSTTPATSTSHLPLDSLSRVRHLFNPWEEPHPGKRLPLAGANQETEKVANAGSYHLNGGRRGGMAAKELTPYNPNRPWLVRRPIRVRARTNTPVPLKITTEISEDHDAKSAPRPAVRDIHVHSAMETTATVNDECESGTEKTDAHIVNVSGKADMKPSDLPLPASPPIDCQFTDLSNLLGINVHSEENIAVDNAEPGTYCHVAPDEDLYGWDAELDRQSKQSSPPLPCQYDHEYQYRRTSLTKRSLLHRVFSMGPIPKDIDIEVRRASSTSS
ncbi:hypothetical protein CGCF415_v013181 [Colletotrichum fructicola]|uniref:Regulator of g-protein signaling n=1 Tax=Colletotrichum fructicola (strain Nara gc5) TaxID=1213859 RepID=L2FR17_COLFN|nr:uncharacterized protein CGMCC3_g10884 [Colletotrichum fructicola]KAE9573132.1 hypothetical protein CGMCC3_g10884 [Colletotrichum fructicola]KAF4884712.1 hypothetical protein CGCFRS4_v012494 [Colletotrichum fructicola]KAF4891961.1 hypothetical protein CGCF415_v013181 [Colletotrichum fructicola]KAF4930769.1 hypothetical protein CGCF245_v011533 [Colletotrichum fructicola]